MGHLGNNFVLDFHEDGLADVQPTFVISTGVWGRSFQRSGPFIRPTHSVDVTTSFLPSFGGGDHALKFEVPVAHGKALGIALRRQYRRPLRESDRQLLGSVAGVPG